MKIRLTRVVLFFIALIIAVGFYILLRHLLDGVESQTYQATEEVMVDTAYLLAEIVEKDIRSSTFKKDELTNIFSELRKLDIEAQIYHYLKKDIGLNVYMTDTDGVVLFHSQDPEKVGDDFSDFNDVARTLKGEYGARSTRENEKESMSSILYVAAPIGDREKPLGVLTVFKKQADGHVFIEERRNWILLSTALIGCGIALLMGAVFVWLFRPIGQLTDYARAVERGERATMPKVGVGREVNTLSRSLLSMREALEGRKYAENYVQTLTHELKSPLAAIKGAAELLSEEMPREQRQRFIDNIQNEVERSQSLINGLLQLSEVEGKAHLDTLEHVDLAKLIDEVLNVYEASMALKSLKIEKRLIDRISVSGDRMLLRSALMNLLENAVSFSSEGGNIEITLLRKDSQAELSIINEGPLIPEFAKKRVFERFYSHRQGANERKTSGLGLALVKEAMALHNGEVVLENHEGAGVCVRLYIPMSRD